MIRRRMKKMKRMMKMKKRMKRVMKMKRMEMVNKPTEKRMKQRNKSTIIPASASSRLLEQWKSKRTQQRPKEKVRRK